MAPADDPSSFARRDWAALESLDRRHWADAFERTGAEASLRASLALWRHMRAIRPEWPTAAERDADLRDHVALKRLLDRAADVAAR